MIRPLLLSLTLIVPAAVAPAQVKSFANLHAELNGAQVVPPNSSNALGDAEFTFDPATRKLHFRVVTTCVAPLPIFRICQAPPGANGPCFFFSSGIYFNQDMYEGTTPPLSSAQVVTLMSGGMYAEIFTGFFGFPEIRGQITPTVRRSLEASLDGSQVVPPTGSTATAFGRFTLVEPDNVLDYELSASGIAGRATEIGIGLPGQPGSTFLTLAGGPDRWSGRSPMLSGAQVAAIRNGSAFVQIESTAFPGGEVRGQIVAGSSWDFVARMTGASALPANGSTASGSGIFHLDNASRVLSGSVTVAGLAPTSVELGVGYAEQAPIFSLPLAGGPTTWTGNTPPLPDSVIQLLLEQGLHATAKSAAFPNGEIRGQVFPNPYLFGYGSLSGASMVRIGHTGEPALGSADWTVTLGGVPASTPSFLFLTFSNSAWLGQAIPVDLQSSGIGRNRSFTWIDSAATGFFHFPVVADAFGTAAVGIPVPNDPAFLGLHSFYQWFVASGGAPAISFSVSPGLQVVVE